MADSNALIPSEEQELFSIFPVITNDVVFVNNNSSGYSGVASSIINNNGVINLSSYELNSDEHSLLSKGSC